MEAAIVLLSPLAAYIVLHFRAGLAEDAQWSRQQMLSGHGVKLGLPAREQAIAQASCTVTAPESGRRVRTTPVVAARRPGDTEVGAPSLGSAR
jgi:hypothetical protein